MCISDIGVIELDQMSFRAHHGCLEKERTEGNLFLVDFRGEKRELTVDSVGLAILEFDK